ncbi:4-hydroxy-tetrahydrodipicolinate reductase [bacterium]|nr:4-hydroxy-tetrahydrodipicolinate reductase [bacterium]
MVHNEQARVPVALVGAGGRMGILLSEALRASAAFELVGLLEGPGHPTLHTRQEVGRGRSVEIVADAATAFREARVVLDFSQPPGTMAALEHVCARKLALVTGTTGFSTEQIDRLRLAAESVAILVAANMSLGINLLTVLLKVLVPRLPDDYDLEIVERHHNQKKDSPSGTAVTLAELIQQLRPGDKARDWQCGRPRSQQMRSRQDLVVHPVRGGGVVGEHHIYAMGQAEEIILSHRAFNRGVFVAGALAAVAFISKARPGFYTMADVIGGSVED